MQCTELGKGLRIARFGLLDFDFVKAKWECAALAESAVKGRFIDTNRKQD